MVPYFDFFSLAEACRAEEEEEEMNIAATILLDLSLSCDRHVSKNIAATAIDKGKGICSVELSLSCGNYCSTSETKSPHHHHHQGNYQVGECSSKHSDNSITLESSLSSGSGIFHHQTDYHEQHNLITKKRERGEKNIPCIKREVKRMKQESSSSTEAASAASAATADPWVIKKQLQKSDVGNLSRLLLSFDQLSTHVFPWWDAGTVGIKKGVPISMWDCDTNTQYEMVFRQWNKGANVLQSNWNRDFVKRRGLKTGDTVGLFCDIRNSRFCFSLLNRATPPAGN